MLFLENKDRNKNRCNVSTSVIIAVTTVILVISGFAKTETPVVAEEQTDPVSIEFSFPPISDDIVEAVQGDHGGFGSNDPGQKSSFELIPAIHVKDVQVQPDDVEHPHEKGHEYVNQNDLDEMAVFERHRHGFKDVQLLLLGPVNSNPLLRVEVCDQHPDDQDHRKRG